ncbi:hypothetical protein CENSYa_0185 [Cenarchaeum symbiosum A]|uniref:Uncharacterized protein n=1 Tax=Cenarchaeum symbiosum (strain A) TaxID=414004 RepID=A0RU12_CENSY|nr:hypothetical protein CENSYa_0185 [Cenarchaeum symbiosum A]
MAELDEFAEALFGQLVVETDEEKQIADLAERIRDDAEFDVSFTGLEDAAGRIFPEMRKRLAGFPGMGVQGEISIELASLRDFKLLKGRKVFTDKDSRGFVDGLFEAVADADAGALVGLIRRDLAKYLVYSTYAIQYLSRISTTYGDFLDGKIYLNDFILSSYPQIILYRQGQPFKARFGGVESGYMGALKMTILEELIHSQQDPLHRMNTEAAIQVNSINEELAGIIIGLEDETASSLYEHMQLQEVPDDFPVAKRANLFFMLNPDNFIVNVLGPDVMTYDRIEIDPEISRMVPELLGVYQKWLGPIQRHHAAFTTMEGMAGFLVEEILGDDPDFQAYLGSFMGTDMSSYRVRKDMGRDFTRSVHEKLGAGTFEMLLNSPPNTKELKDPARYLGRVGS